MSSNYEILRAELEHVPVLAPLFDLYRVFYGQESDLAAAEAFLRERLAYNESVVFLARDSGSGQGLGFTQLYPTFSSVSMKAVWTLNDLYVVAEARRLGVARGLMNAAKLHALQSGAKGLQLETQADNVQAQRLYESLGYVKDEGYHYFLSV